MSDNLVINPNPSYFTVNKLSATLLRKIYSRLIRIKGQKIALKSIIDSFYNMNIEDNTVMILGLRQSVYGSMQYILDELNSNPVFSDYKIYVKTKEKTDSIVNEFIRQNNWNKTSTVPTGYYNKLESCKYLITESYFPYQWIKKKEQIYINIWHGTPLKKIGLRKNGKKAHRQSNQQKNFICTDYFLYPNDFTKEVMIDSFEVASLMQGKALMLGYPRTAGLLKISKERTEEIRKTIAPNNEKVYAYMPTFRGYMNDEDTIEREKDILRYLDERLNDDQILFVNLHQHISKGLDCSEFKHIQYFPSLIDSYELLTATDALITDYSSVSFDYLVLGKQIIHYIEDYDTYSAQQGLNMDIRELPFDLAYNRDDIVTLLNKGKTYDDTEIRERLCKYDSADAPSKLCQLFSGNENGLILDEHPHDDRKKILFYSQCLKEGPETELLRSFSGQIDKTIIDYRIGCDNNKTHQHKGSAYPLLHEVQCLSSEDDLRLSSIGTPVKDLYLAGKMSFKTAMRFLIHEYGLFSIQEYGYTVFDTLVIYDTSDANMILSLALSAAKKKVLFLTNEILTKIDNGDRFLKDSVRFASSYCSVIAVTDSAYIESAQKLLPKTWKDKVSVLSTTDGLNKLLSL